MIQSSCKTCKWWEPFSGACTNGDSRHRGDFRTGDFCCTKYERNIHEGCGGVLEGRVHNGKAVHYCYSCLYDVTGPWIPCERTKQP